MGVHVRTKELKDGKLSLYIDYYPPIRKANGKFTRREFLNRTIFKKPKNADEKRFNKEQLHFAETVRLKREKEIWNEEDGIYNSDNKKRDFIQYFKDVAEKKNEGNGIYHNWLGSLHYLEVFTGGRCKMGDINEDFCNRFKNYLISADRLNTVSGLKFAQNSAVSYFNKFRSIVNHAFDDRYINENPLKHIKCKFRSNSPLKIALYSPLISDCHF